MVKICNNNTYEGSHDAFTKYPYPLSTFQKYAIAGIIDNRHVLVCAPTGSGKTLPAEFAIEHFHHLGKKTIYTSPIKALSNQKFYEFTRKFPHITIGLCTGDIKLNPSADVLIMTTEILMNYLFQIKNTSGSYATDFDLNIDDLACVIFDEVHYINDESRGQVWENTILMLPPTISMVMLSATIDAPEQFAKWIESRPESKEVWLCETHIRSVPLTHYSFITVSEGFIKSIKDKTLEQEIRRATNTLVTLRDKTFHESAYHSVKKMLTLFDNRQQYIKRQFVLNRLATFLKEREMLPAILFVFSRKQVECVAHEITANLLEDDSKIPYTVGRECEEILRSKLSNYREYLELPEYIDLVKLLEKGIGYHHSGMIPILREIVELFIAKKTIKILVATESFAIGLDCPIKTAVFISMEKFDGRSMRLLHSHEYTQMAGRAGRRGIDTIGNVIHCNNLFSFPTISEYREILNGIPQKLVSKFAISYSMVFSLLHGGSVSLLELRAFIEKSMVFREIQSSLENEKKILEKMAPIETLDVSEEVRQYIELRASLTMANNKKRKEIERTIAKFPQDVEKRVAQYETNLALHNQRKKQEDVVRSIESYVDDQIAGTLNILQKYGYVETIAGATRLTLFGEFASHFAEMHPILFSQVFTRMEQFRGWNGIRIITFLSFFLNIKMGEETDEGQLVSEDVKNAFECLRTVALDLEHAEEGCAHDYESLISPQWAPFIVKWCACNDERSCKEFIQGEVASRGISIGDFTKAILKIVNMVRELEKAQPDNVELLFELAKVPSMIMKYTMTAQSLYL